MRSSNIIPFNVSGAEEKLQLRPRWFNKTAGAIVILSHFVLFASFIRYLPEEFGNPDVLTVDLVGQGDFFDAEAISESYDSPEEKVEYENLKKTENMLELPKIKNPDAVMLQMKKEEEEQKKIQKDHGQQKESKPSTQALEAQTMRRAGSPKSSANQGGAASRATCLARVAMSLCRRTPAISRLGKGWANVSFNVESGGGVSQISITASTSGHAALARRIVEGVSGGSSCGFEFVSQKIIFD